MRTTIPSVTGTLHSLRGRALAEPSTETLTAMLSSLYAMQKQLRPDDAYLADHAAERVIRTQVRVFRFYAPYLPATGDVLDWGCRHAPDSCLLHATFGDAHRLHGCDFVEPDDYGVFHQYARLNYRPLQGVIELPYDDESFDVVIGSGTLEHVAFDYESLKELYRVLRPDGKLIVSYLPNRWSVEEWNKRRLGVGFHRRLYGKSEFVRLLKSNGFDPLTVGYQTRLDLLGERGLVHRLARGVRWLLPAHRFCSTLCAVAVKVRSM
jgi:SAM-dependent methyltransferase